MGRSPERTKGLKIAGIALAAASMAGWFGAEPIAERIIGEPEAPVAPSEPQRVTAERGPMDIAIGLDVSPSAIKLQLPNVVEQTRNFLVNAHFVEGDTVRVCTFAESAKCESFTMPGQRDAAVNKVASVKTVYRKGIKTYVNQAITQMVSGLRSPGVLMAWTDARDETKTGNAPLAAGHQPVIIVVPNEDYIGAANSVDSSLGDDGVEVALAKTAEDFGNLLEKETGKLDRQAQGVAQGKADAAYSLLIEQYGRDQATYKEELANSVQKKQEARAAIVRAKKVVKVTAGALFASAMAALGTLVYLKLRPKMYGWILDVNGTYPQKYELPTVTTPVSLNNVSSRLPAVTLTPKKDGIYKGTQVLTGGTQVSQGVYWFAEEPDGATVKRLSKEKPSATGGPVGGGKSALDF